MHDAARRSHNCSLEGDWFLNVTRVSVAQVPLRRAAAVSEPRFLRDMQWSWDDKAEGVGGDVLVRILCINSFLCI